MCGRYALYGPRSRSRPEHDYFSSLEQFPGSWNVAPGQTLPISRLGHDGAIEQVTARWGLVPYWSKDEKTGYKCINARAESIANTPAFREPYRTKRRCLVPACGFYEWQKHPAGKQPYYITSVDGSLLAFAGLWDTWKKPDGDSLTTFTVLTTTPNALMQRIHDRMPVILEPENYRTWLEADNPSELLKPAPVGMLQCFPVSSRVNSPKNDAPDLIAPARDAPGTSAALFDA
jgi:putative SOS response-associated peptidase YedK